MFSLCTIDGIYIFKEDVEYSLRTKFQAISVFWPRVI
jgi:hypothetical protein